MGMRCWIMMLLVVCVAVSVSAQAPAVISYQGKLVESSGIPVTGIHDLQVDLFTTPTGGAALWTEGHTGVMVSGGLFSVALGETISFPAGLFTSNPELWLEITLDGSETFSRVRLVSAPFALVAYNSARLTGLEASQFLRSDSNATYSGGTLAVAGGSTLNVAGTFQLGGTPVSATAAQLNELVGGGQTTLHSHAPGDATTLDGLDSLQFLRADTSATYSGGTLAVAGGATVNVAGTFQLGGATVSATAAQLNELVGGGVTTLHSHAAGDATTLDGLDSAQFLRSDVNDQASGRITFNALPGGTAYGDAIVFINPASANANESLLCAQVGSTAVMLLDAEGDYAIDGTLIAGAPTPDAARAYHTFGTGAAEGTDIADANDVYITDSLEIDDDLFVGSIMQIGKATPSAGQAYNSITSGDYTPVSALMGNSGDLAIEYDLEVGSDLYVGDTISWSAKTRHYMVHPSDFLPSSSGVSFVCSWDQLYKNGAGIVYFYAPIHLPDGAVVTRLDVWYYDNASNEMSILLSRYSYGQDATPDTLAAVYTSGAPGETSGYDNTISLATIDNNSYTYALVVMMEENPEGSNLIFRNAKITYTITGP